MIREMLAAWRAWDHWCAAYSKKHADAKKLNRLPYISASEGEHESRRLEEALAEFAEWAGQSTLGLRDRMALARRCGGSREHALAAAVGHT